MENHNFENQGTFNREMNSRHLQMLSIGGVSVGLSGQVCS